MELIKITNQSRRDFDGILKCQFCGHEEVLNGGYDDNYYHTEVIPSFVCPQCNKSTISENDAIRANKTKYPEGYQI